MVCFEDVRACFVTDFLRNAKSLLDAAVASGVFDSPRESHYHTGKGGFRRRTSDRVPQREEHRPMKTRLVLAFVAVCSVLSSAERGLSASTSKPANRSPTDTSSATSGPTNASSARRIAKSTSRTRRTRTFAISSSLRATIAGRSSTSPIFFCSKPVEMQRGNKRLSYDVNNRGNKLMLGAFNNAGGNDPRTLADAGNGFLMERGYSLLWCGWNGDVLPGGGRMQIDLPIAMENGEAVKGKVFAEICVHAAYAQPLYLGEFESVSGIECRYGDVDDAALYVRPRRAKCRAANGTSAAGRTTHLPPTKSFST